MSRIDNKTVLASLALIVGLPSVAFAADSPLGIWYDDKGRAAIEIAECDNGSGKLCGHAVWLRDAGDVEKGCRRQIIGDLAKVSSKTWDDGWVYSPERKRRYNLEVKPLSDDRLQVKGYAGSKFFSKTMIWKRAPDDIERCDAQKAPIMASTTPDAEKAPVETKRAPAATETGPAVVTEAPSSSEEAPPLRQERAKRVIESDVTANDAPAIEPEREAKEEKKVAQAEPDNEAEDAPMAKGPLEGLDLGKYFKKTGGDCKLNTPWISLSFKCDN